MADESTRARKAKWDRSDRRKELLKKWTRDRTCVECNKVEQVRKDNPGERCAPCARRAFGRIGAAQKTRIGAKQKKPVQLCLRFGRHAPRAVRICKQCRDPFQVRRSALSGKTNASGNFCSRPCYDEWLGSSGKEPSRGFGWKKTARAVLAAFPFCAWCGTRHKLQVHHIVPFRIVRDNSPERLVPLCVKHHRWIETITVGILRETEGEDPDKTLAPLAAMIRFRQAATLKVLRSVHDELNSRTSSAAMAD